MTREGWLRAHGFKGAIAVYPYNDPYRPELDALLPRDLLIIGHGSGAGMLSRSFETLGPMGDTWIDNLFASFRQAPTPRMKRLLADRGSFWIGGAYQGTELPWEALGYFGTEPTASVNSLRYWWGSRTFGAENALAFVALSDAYEHLWDLYDVPMLPQNWVKLSPGARARVSAEGWERLRQFEERLAALKQAAGGRGDAARFAHLRLFGTYFNYLLRWLELFTEMQALVAANRGADSPPESARAKLLFARDEVYRLAAGLEKESETVPGNMISATRRFGLLQPFKEWVQGYDGLEWFLDVKQFTGSLSVLPVQMAPGKPFTLQVVIHNSGIWPWVAGVGHRLELGEDAARLGLPAQWDYDGAPMVYADRRVVELHGVAPAQAGEGTLDLRFLAPFRNPTPCAQCSAKLQWR